MLFSEDLLSRWHDEIWQRIERAKKILRWEDWWDYRKLNELIDHFWYPIVQRACKLAKLLAIFFSDLVNECQCIRKVMSTYSKSDVNISTSDVSLSLPFFYITRWENYLKHLKIWSSSTVYMKIKFKCKIFQNFDDLTWLTEINIIKLSI